MQTTFLNAIFKLQNKNHTSSTGNGHCSPPPPPNGHWTFRVTKVGMNVVPNVIGSQMNGGGGGGGLPEPPLLL